MFERYTVKARRAIFFARYRLRSQPKYTFVEPFVTLGRRG
jgi:hypothetical protein